MRKLYYALFIAMLLPLLHAQPQPSTLSISSLEVKNVMWESNFLSVDSEAKFSCTSDPQYSNPKITLRLYDTDYQPVTLAGGLPSVVSGIPCDVIESSYLFQGIQSTGAYIVVATIDAPSKCNRCSMRDGFAVVKILERRVPDNTPILAFAALASIVLLLNLKK